MSKMKQVSQEEFEVLTRFHPGEIRYYADTSVEISRNKGARVNVRRTPKGSNGVAAPTKKNFPMATRGQHVQLGVKGAGNMRPDSIQYSVYCAATRLLAEDPTKVISRADLTNRLEVALPPLNRVSQIIPAISALIKTKRLRYTGAS